MRHQPFGILILTIATMIGCEPKSSPDRPVPSAGPGNAARQAPAADTDQSPWWSSAPAVNADALDLSQAADPNGPWIVQSSPIDAPIALRTDPLLAVTVVPAQAGQTIKMTSRAALGTNIEARARIRLTNLHNASPSAVIELAKPDAASPGLRVNLSANSNTVSINVTHADKPLHDAKALAENADWQPQVNNNWIWNLRAYTNTQPGWPEDYRHRIEHDMAALPDQNEKWLDVRVQLTDTGVAVWLEDRIIVHKQDPDLTTEGLARITLNQGAQLAHFSVRPIQSTPGFLPLPLAGYANASKINGAAVDPTSLPATDTVAQIDGIPFVFSPANPEGNDHIDVGTSLYRQANFHGYMPTFDVRWKGSTLRDPARIQLRIPNRQFDALYVIAASDSDPDDVPILSAMFYRPLVGQAKTFATEVPLATAQAGARSLPVKLEDGSDANLYLIKIPLDPGLLSILADIDIIELELTKQVALHRSYPDPISYNHHQAGPPSAVHVYALTLAESPVGFSFEPGRFGHVWTDPQTPSYTSTVTNHTDHPQDAKIKITTRSYDGSESTTHNGTIRLAPGQTGSLDTQLPVKLYGTHDVTVTLTAAGRTWTEQRTFCHLAPDTRPAKWTEGQGALFGYWAYHGGHYTPNAKHVAGLMTLAGARASFGVPKAIWEEDFFKKHWEPGLSSPWILSSQPIGTGIGYQVPPPWTAHDDMDPAKVQKFKDDLVAAWNLDLERMPPGYEPRQVFFYPEPHISLRLTAGNVPDYWNGEPYEYTEHETERLKMYYNTARIAAETAREHFPDRKILMPWGDPGFAWPFLRMGFPTDLIDGSGLDNPGFERLPEMQLHQVALHRLYITKKEYEKAGIDDPHFLYCEGTFVPTEPGAVTYREQMDLYQRWALLSMAYGVSEFYSGWFGFDSGDYYATEHYGGCGIQRRIPYCDPKPAYAAFATMTDRLAAANFQNWIPTGSLTTYCLRFNGPKGDVYALWNIRGDRPVTLTLAKDADVNVIDSMNNTTVVPSRGRKVTVTTDPSVIYITGCEITAAQVGQTDHSDAAPSDTAVQVADLADGSWKYTNEKHEFFETNTFAVFPYFGRFSSQTVNDPDHGKVLQSTLEDQDEVHQLMPWYNTLTPAKPIPLNGAPSHLGLWVKGASDWGRVIYILRDAKGERWTSIGFPDQWNCDDVHSTSSFNFDGWRYIRFELPGHYGYDNFRKYGTTWWRADDGDSLTDLPLALEQIIIEQRTHVIYVNDVQPAASNTVLLGKLFVEYDNPQDNSDEAVRVSRLRMPPPGQTSDLTNPILEHHVSSLAPASQITKIVPPDHYADGTRAHIHFQHVPAATKYFIWVGPNPDGSGAVNMTPNGATSGALVTGMRPGVKLYYWVTWVDNRQNKSVPSDVVEQVLIDQFKEK
ncbi:MAG: hypothetical protein CMJ49_02445 [Planctomycetaceae bacterium]|nr:hypothetical protein [Planctomycetaceae bacterium]